MRSTFLTWTVFLVSLVCFFFFNDTATTEIYTLSLHDALPICSASWAGRCSLDFENQPRMRLRDRKSTRLNSSHANISYAVFCLKKKKSPPLARPRKQINKQQSQKNTTRGTR